METPRRLQQLLPGLLQRSQWNHQLLWNVRIRRLQRRVRHHEDHCSNAGPPWFITLQVTTSQIRMPVEDSDTLIELRKLLTALSTRTCSLPSCVVFSAWTVIVYAMTLDFRSSQKDPIKTPNRLCRSLVAYVTQGSYS